MERKSNDCLEWSFENLSCWNSEIHGKYLEYRYCPLKLYPRGLNGNGQHLVVEVYDPSNSSRVELSYISSNGTSVMKQEMQDPKWSKHWMTLPLGPKFDDVVRASSKNKVLKDILTLHLYRSDYVGTKFHGLTKIDVADISLKIPTAVFKGEKLVNCPTWISSFSFNNSRQKYFFNLNPFFDGSTLENAKLAFAFYPNIKGNVLIHTNVSLLDSNNAVIKSEENRHIFRDEKGWVLSSIWQRKEILEKEFHFTLLVKFISGDIQNRYSLPWVEYVDPSSIKPIIIPTQNLAENLTKNFNAVSSESPSVSVLLQELMCLYQDQDFSDVTLKCENVTFPVHKNILNARSPVFKTMLSCDMREAASDSVDIEDLNPSTLARFLAFLYTGAVEDLQGEIALKLYYAADKYQVPSLMKECADFLCSNVSISNVCGILSLADKHQDDPLTSVAHNFILKNYNAVLISEEWKDLLMKEPLLCAKTLTQFVEQNRMREINTSQSFPPL